MNNNSQHLDQQFSNVYFNSNYAQIVLLLLANQEMTLESIVRHVCSFKSQAKKKEFEGITFNYRHYVLEQKPIASAEQVKQRENEFCETFVRRYIEEITPKYQDLEGRPQKKFLQTGIQDQMNSLLYQLKADQLETCEDDPGSSSKADYLKKLILSIIERSSRDPDEEVADKIIKYGGVDVSLAHPLFAGDQNFRNRFKNTLYNCKTFNELKKYGGEDISIVRSQLQRSISKILISLKFDQQPSQQICEELLKNPLCHIVAGHKKLTNDQKESYYSSDFYKGYKLKKYSSTVGYEESLEQKVKEDVAKILNVIEEQLRVTGEILNHVLNFNIYPLLKVGAIRNIKQSVFRTIINDCPNYLTAFKLVYYQKRSVESLREDPSISQRLELAKVFFKIKLPYEEWKTAEDNILQRRYNIVDDLTLKLPSTSQLMQYIFDVVEPYFHKQEKITDYRSDVELTLIQEIMETELSDLSFERIQLIVNQTLDDPNYESAQAKNLSPSDKDCYNDRIVKNEKFCTFKANRRRDIEEENYLQAIQLKKKIYKNNLGEKLNVYYEKVDQFVKEIIRNGGKMPQYGSFVTNISKLFQDQKEKKLQAENKANINVNSPQNNANSPQNNANSPQNVPSQVPRYNEEEMVNNLSSLANSFFQAYVTKNKESFFQKYLTQKFGGNKTEYVKRLIETNAFENQSSNFFDSLGAKNILLNKVKKQFAQNADFATSELRECRKIITMLTSRESSQSQPKSKPSDTVSKEQLEEEFKVEVKNFFDQYFKENAESLLEKILSEKYEKDTIKLAKALLQGKVFEKNQGPFYDNLGYKNILLGKIKAEFMRNEAFASTLLKTSAAIWMKIK